MKNLDSVLTIDPGVNTGWAFWNGGRVPRSTGVFRVEKRKASVSTLRVQLEQLCTGFGTVVNLLSPRLIIIEDCRWWSGSKESMAALNSGDLHKLTLIIGGYCFLSSNRDIPWELIDPCKWKGQLDHNALAAQVEHLIGKQYRHHELEAVGIGLNRAGIL